MDEGVPMSHVEYKKWLCRPVDLKKTSCRPADVRKASCRISLRPKKGHVSLLMLGKPRVAYR